MLSPVTFSEPPDGGYGWVIVIGAFICLSIASGSQFAFGLFFSDLQTLSDAPLAAGVLSAEYCFLQAFGVVSGLLIERFGERAVVFTGGVVSAIGFIGSSYAPSIEILFLTHGLLVGAGFSLVCTSSGLVVTRWFAKRRATAVGIVVAGSGLGTMAIGPAVQVAIDAFGWRGAMRVVAAITCVIPIASLLFRPIKINNASLQTNIKTNEASMDDVDGKTSSPSLTSSLAAGTELVGPSLLCDSLFITWCIALALYSGSFYSVLTHFSTAVKESGTSATGASLLVSLQGFSNIVGRLTMGVL
jgi:MFS family permease